MPAFNHPTFTRRDAILVEFGLELLVRSGHADAAPLVDRVDAARCIGLGDVAIEKLELQVAGASLSEQLFRLLARLGDVLGKSGQRDEFRLGQRHCIARAHDPAHVLEDRYLREGLRATPTVAFR